MISFTSHFLFISTCGSYWFLFVLWIIFSSCFFFKVFHFFFFFLKIGFSFLFYFFSSVFHFVLPFLNFILRSLFRGFLGFSKAFLGSFFMPHDSFCKCTPFRTCDFDGSNKMFQKTCKQHQIKFTNTIVRINILELFNTNELEANIAQSTKMWVFKIYLPQCKQF